MVSMLETRQAAPASTLQARPEGRDHELASETACLVAEYLAYTQAAGYAMSSTAVFQREQAARSFLKRFPQPAFWLSLPLEAQLRCSKAQRRFLDYLFLRHILPLPAGYILARRQPLGKVAHRLMERDTYELYGQMAKRLGYDDPVIGQQFHTLICVMAWAQKPVHAITHDDLDAFTADLRAAFGAQEERAKAIEVQGGLPRRWATELAAVRHVLCHLGILPRQPTRPRKTFSQKWAHIPPCIDTCGRWPSPFSPALWTGRRAVCAGSSPG